MKIFVFFIIFLASLITPIFASCSREQDCAQHSTIQNEDNLYKQKALTILKNLSKYANGKHLSSFDEVNYECVIAELFFH